MRLQQRFVEWKTAAKGVARGIATGALPGSAAQMSFYFFLSVFPVLLVLVAVLGLFLGARWLIRDTVVSSLSLIAPASLAETLDRLLDNLTPRAEGPLSVGIVIALWAASSGMVAAIRALNRAYAVHDPRPWWRRRAVGIALTLAFMLLTAAAMVLLAYGGPIAEAAARSAGLGALFVRAWGLAQWPVIGAVLLVAFHLLYRFAPHRTNPPRRWLQPGTLIGVALWLGASFGLKLYIANFPRYDLAYGSVGAVIVLLLWFYLTSMAILIGAEINAQFESVRSSCLDAG